MVANFFESHVGPTREKSNTILYLLFILYASQWKLVIQKSNQKISTQGAKAKFYVANGFQK